MFSSNIAIQMLFISYHMALNNNFWLFKLSSVSKLASSYLCTSVLSSELFQLKFITFSWEENFWDPPPDFALFISFLFQFI